MAARWAAGGFGAVVSAGIAYQVIDSRSFLQRKVILPLFKKLDSETAHELAIASLGAGEFGN
jgi:hypothetical protein